MTTRERIRRLRRALEEDVRVFGARFGRSGRTVEAWESGRRTPEVLVLWILTDIENNLENSRNTP